MRVAWALLLICALGCGSDGSDEPRAAPNAMPGQPDASIDATTRSPHASLDGQAAMLDGRVSAREAGGDAMGASPPNPASIVWFVPDDNSGLAADGGLGLSVYTFTPRVSRDEALRELAEALELVRWPSAEPLPAQVRYDVAVPEYKTQVTLHPLQRLAEGRYALRLKQSLANARFHSVLTPVIGGRPTSRFYVGSDPVVRLVQVCDKGEQTKLIVSFSEPVHGGVVEVFAGDMLVPCGEPTVHGAWLEVVCAATPPASLRVRFARFSSDSGVPLESHDGGMPDYSFTVASLPRLDCPVYIAGP